MIEKDIIEILKASNERLRIKLNKAMKLLRERPAKKGILSNIR